MSATQSRWRQESRRIIAAVLGQMPDATLAEKQKALRDAYPYGERKMWPYKCWLAEVRLALKPRAVPIGAVIAVFPAGVSCSWCNSKGCLCCAAARDFHEKHAEWMVAMRENPLARFAFADWLEEQGDIAAAVEWRTKEL